jgi:hypothetical protein
VKNHKSHSLTNPILKDIIGKKNNFKKFPEKDRSQLKLIFQTHDSVHKVGITPYKANMKKL